MAQLGQVLPTLGGGNGQAAEGPLWWLSAGGPVVAVLLVVSVVAVAVVLLKLYQFAALRVWSMRGIEEALARWRLGRSGEALEILAATRSPVARVVEAAVQGVVRKGGDDPKVREEVTRLASLWQENLGRYLRVLEVVGALSPLLGLLGTVLGMIEAFQQLESAGSRVSPALLAGGVWEALLTTAAGLSVAIPTVAVLHGLEHVVTRVGQRMEDAVTRVFTRELGDEGARVEPRPVRSSE